MADLDEKFSSQAIKIVGADSAGVETNYAKTLPTGKLQTANITNDGGIQGVLTVGTSAVEAKIGGSPLTDRVSLTVYNDSDALIYFGFDNTVTTATGTPIFKKQLVAFDVGPDTSVYLIAGAASKDARITESA